MEKKKLFLRSSKEKSEKDEKIIPPDSLEKENKKLLKVNHGASIKDGDENLFTLIENREYSRALELYKKELLVYSANISIYV